MTECDVLNGGGYVHIEWNKLLWLFNLLIMSADSSMDIEVCIQEDKVKQKISPPIFFQQTRIYVNNLHLWFEKDSIFYVSKILRTFERKLKVLQDIF